MRWKCDGYKIVPKKMKTYNFQAPTPFTLKQKWWTSSFGYVKTVSNSRPGLFFQNICLGIVLIIQRPVSVQLK